VLDVLRQKRPGCLHVIDPFKVGVDAAARKARALEERDYPAIILGSTDYIDFERHITAYIDDIKAAVQLPIILHFPPRRPAGIPFAPNADAIIWPALLGSEDEYFVWGSFFETLTYAAGRGTATAPRPERIVSAALTFGSDEISYRTMAVQPIDPTPRGMAKYMNVIDVMGFDMVYLYSRHQHVPPETCELVKRGIGSDRLLIVSGNVWKRDQIDAYHRAGADYVAFAGALEDDDWPDRLPQLW
jgi:heptaprenylglyceryl phosphate synthase